MLVLASASPRRKELLSLITTDFTIDAADVNERLPAGISPMQAVRTLAERKALAVAERHPANDVIIGSDTVVSVSGTILGKPKSHGDAARMLRMLSGITHHVFTGVCICQGDSKTVFTSSAAVTFGEMSDDEIEAYLATGEPFDKAGAYGIQGYGARYIERIGGDYYAVMGLPVRELYVALRELHALQ
jgi:septum formation protein